MLGFREFVQAYHSGAILEDAGWRAYDIEGIAGKRHAKEGLKALGYLDTSFFGFEQAARDFGLTNATQARHLLSLWWAWTRIALGEMRNAKLREGTGNDS